MELKETGDQCCLLWGNGDSGAGVILRDKNLGDDGRDRFADEEIMHQQLSTPEAWGARLEVTFGEQVICVKCEIGEPWGYDMATDRWPEQGKVSQTMETGIYKLETVI